MTLNGIDHGKRKAKAVKPKQIKVYEDPDDQQAQAPTVPHVIKLKEVSVKIPVDEIRRIRNV